MNFKKNLTPATFLISSLAPFIILACWLFLNDPPVWPDEAIYSDIVNNLVNFGQLSTNIFGGAISGLNIQANWYPPFYFYFLTVWVKLFGPGIEVLRFSSLVLAITSLIIIFFLSKNLFKNFFLASLGVLMISLDYNFFRGAKIARMEMLIFLFLVINIFIITVNKKNKPWALLMIGVLSGLAVITHPMGIIVPVMSAIAFLLASFKLKDKIYALGLILLIVSIAVGWWFFSMSNNLELFFSQMSIQLGRKSISPPFYLVYWRMDFWWRVFFSSYLVISAILARKILHQPKRSDLLIMSGIILTFLGVTFGKEGWYLIYLQLFISLAILSILKDSWKSLRSVFITTLVVAALIFLIGLHFSIGNWLYYGTGGNNYHQFTKQISDALPDRGNILLSSIPDPYFDLAYKYSGTRQLFEFVPIPILDNDYNKLLDNVDYIVINEIPDLTLLTYLKTNTESITDVKQTEKYAVKVIKLRSKDRRL